MGWFFEMFHRDRREFVASLVAPSRWVEGVRVIAHREVGNNLWSVIRNDNTGTTSIHLDKLAKERGSGWGYKPIPEECGPVEVNCPVSFIKMCAGSPPTGYAAEWRQKVLRHHERAKLIKKHLPKPEAGLKVQVGESAYTLVEPHPHRKGWWIVERSPCGVRYRMPPVQLNRCLVIAAGEAIDRGAQ